MRYVKIKINNNATHAMVDTDITYNFIVEEKVHCLGLIMEKNSSKVKVVNSEAHLMQGLVKGVQLEVKH